MIAFFDWIGLLAFVIRLAAIVVGPLVAVVNSS